MADIVNPQITDAVQQPAQAPVNALDALFLAASHALSDAMQNAVSAQQQAVATQQAATTQGVELLYGLIGDALSSKNVTAPEDVLNTFDSIKAQIAAHMATCRTASADSCSEQSARQGGFHAITLSVVDSFALSLDRLSETHYRQSLRTIQIAATVGVLAALNRSPDQAKNYENVLALIQSLI